MSNASNTALATAAAAVALGLALASAPLRAEPSAAPLSPDDFAYAVELTPAAGSAVQTALVPVEVYRGALRADLADVRVFNAQGDAVPHAIRALDAPQRAAAVEHTVPHFPLLAPKGAAAPDVALRLHVERSATGSVVDIRTEPRAEPGADPDVIAYVLDLGGLARDVVALRLELDSGGASFAVPLAIDGSDDLTQFRTLVSEAVVAQLDHQGRSIVRDRIALPPARPAFLRVTAKSGALPVRIRAAHVELAAEELPPERLTLRVPGRRKPGARGVYEFDLGGPVPAERARIVLPDDNVLVQAELGSSSGRKGPFDAAFAGQLYRVRHDGVLLESPAIELQRRRHRWFELRVDEKGGGLGSALPALEVEYAPDQLLFVARGPAPFRLAYGSRRAEAAAFDAGELLATLPADARGAVPRQSVQPGKRITLAGERALAAPEPELPIRTYVLWAVLLGGALVLAVLALRLLRKLG